MNDLPRTVIQTLAFFDMFETPLTREEVFRFLWKSTADREAVYQTLDNLTEEGKVRNKHSLFYLPGSDDHVDARGRAYPIVLEKLRIARRAAKIIRFIPHVRAMFVCNTVAFGAAKRESDIDVFIIIDDGRLWLTRFLITSVLGLLRMRRTKKRIASKICLSFFVTKSAMALHDVAIDPPDIYLAYWIAELFPMYDPDNMEELLHQKNSWVTALLPHAIRSTEPAPYAHVLDSRSSRIIKRFFERAWQGSYGDLLESQAKRIQEAKMKFNTGSVHGEQNTHVVISDTMLKFHENDRRAYYQGRWYETVQKYSKEK